jgi:YggT family protein
LPALRLSSARARAACLARAPSCRVADAPDAPSKGRSNIMYSLLNLISTAVTLYIYVLIASAVMSWLLAFNILNTQNRVVYMISDFLYRVTEPALRPLRRWIPLLGGVDITPIILILLLVFARDLLFEMFV